MFDLILRRIAATIIGAVLGAFAAGAAAIAAGFALYALLAPQLGAPAAAGLTALAFGVLAAVLLIFIPLVWRRRRSETRAREEAQSVGTAVEIGLGLLGAALGLFRRRRPSRGADSKEDRDAPKGRARRRR